MDPICQKVTFCADESLESAQTPALSSISSGLQNSEINFRPTKRKEQVPVYKMQRISSGPQNGYSVKFANIKS